MIKAYKFIEHCIGTIAPGVDDFIIDVRSREDVEIHDVTKNNRKLLLEIIGKRRKPPSL